MSNNDRGLTGKHVCLFAEALRNRAGIERMTVELANMLSELCDVTVILIDKYDKEASPYRLNEGVRIRSLESSFRGLNIGNIKRLRGFLRELRPDVVITVATPLVRISAPAMAGMNIRHISWEHFNLYAGSKAGSVYKMLAAWMVDTTVVLTEADACDYRKCGAPHIKTIPNFTSIGVNKPSECTEKVVLAVGRHARQKGFDMLIKAWAKTEADGWMLKIVGSGELMADHKRLAEDAGVADRIKFMEATSDIAREFQNASCFVLSSRFEGLVLVLIEAKMMGLPCISFDCPNSPREVIHDGDDGWLVEAEDVDGLAAMLTKRLADMEALRTAGRKGHEDAMSRYSPEAVRKMWVELIK